MVSVASKHHEVLAKHEASVTISSSWTLALDFTVGAILMLLLMVVRIGGTSGTSGGLREQVLPFFHRCIVMVEALVGILDYK